MKTYKNVNFKVRNYETTQVVFAVTENEMSSDWVECNTSEIQHMRCQRLHTQNGVKYFGYL